MGFGCVLLYGAGAYWALDNRNIFNKFEKYAPFGSQLLEFIEEREHNKKMKARKEYYDALDNTTAPFISRRYKMSDDNQHDPLKPEMFFDAKSGIVSEQQREYLPLILLPDIRDPVVHDVSFAMNDLIASINASAASKQIVTHVADTLTKLATSVRNDHSEYADMFANYSKVLNDVALTYSPDKDLYEYHQELSRLVLEIEQHLVAHLNTRGQKKAAVTPLIDKKSDTKTSKSSWKSPSLELDNSLAILELELTLTLLVTALHSHSSLASIKTYIQSMRDVVGKFPDRAYREVLIKRALEGVSVPSDVDLKPIIDDLLQTTSMK